MTNEPEVYLSETRILARVDELAKQISADYANASELNVVGVLRGAFIFLADLMRRLTIARRVDFIALEVTSAEPGQPERIDLRMDLLEPLTGRHVLVVDDVCDTGITQSWLLSELSRREPASLKLCTLIDKPVKRHVELPIAYSAFKVGEEMLVGYGLGLKGEYRNLRDIRRIVS